MLIIDWRASAESAIKSQIIHKHWAATEHNIYESIKPRNGELKEEVIDIDAMEEAREDGSLVDPLSDTELTDRTVP